MLLLKLPYYSQLTLPSRYGGKVVEGLKAGACFRRPSQQRRIVHTAEAHVASAPAYQPIKRTWQTHQHACGRYGSGKQANQTLRRYGMPRSAANAALGAGEIKFTAHRFITRNPLVERERPAALLTGTALMRRASNSTGAVRS